MAERKPGSDNSENLPEGFIFGVPVEGVVNGDGSAEIISEGFVVAQDEESARSLLRAFEEQTGNEVLHFGTPDGNGGSGKSTIGFSRSRWNSSWEPQGPKPNWKIEPQDPSLN